MVGAGRLGGCGIFVFGWGVGIFVFGWGCGGFLFSVGGVGDFCFRLGWVAPAGLDFRGGLGLISSSQRVWG